MPEPPLELSKQLLTPSASLCYVKSLALNIIFSHGLVRCWNTGETQASKLVTETFLATIFVNTVRRRNCYATMMDDDGADCVCLQLIDCWKRQMEYNYFDRCPVVGNHPYHRNFLMASGSVGHGAQFAPAVGRALMQLIIDGEFKEIDLSRLTFDRILDDEPISERLVL